MKIRSFLLVVGLSATVAPGCDSDPEPRFNLRRGKAAALRPISSCGDLQSTVREHLRLRMEQQLARNLDSALQQLAYYRPVPEWCDYGWGWSDGDYSADAGGPPPNASAPGRGDDGAESGNEASAGDYSTTNNQVAGVDEADFIKNDGNDIFLLAGSELLIIDAWPAEQTHVVSSFTFEGRPLKLFISGDRAVVYENALGAPACSGYGEADYYYPTQSSNKLHISVLDISDRAAPRLERRLEVNGALGAARRTGDAIHSVVTFSNDVEHTLQLQYWASIDYCDESVGEGDIRAAYARLLGENHQRIATADLGDFLPSAVSTIFPRHGQPVVSQNFFAGCEGFYEPSTVAQQGYLSVLTFLAADHDSFGAATILGRSGIVYASPESLYVAIHEGGWSYGWYGEDDAQSRERTTLHRFGLSGTGGAPFYRASGEVPGRLVNQFAMDEHDDYLRVATTLGYLPDPNTSNNVFVLRESLSAPPAYATSEVCDDGLCLNVDDGAGEVIAAGQLAVIGALTDLAKTEDIRSVRFDGERGFMVTFKKTDPLFAFDLSNPREPKVLGELKIPGFSTYMHLMDERHLLTIGFDASDQGSFAWFTGIMLQIFDVSDLEDPRLVHKELIGSRGTTSDSTDDHLAFNYFPSRELLAIPMGICDGGDGNGGYGSQLTFNGLLVYHVTAEEGFTLLGGVDHRDPAAEQDPYGYSSYNCWSWWENPNSQVKRSVFMEDFVYSISAEHLKVNQVGALDATLVSLDLPQVQTQSCW